MPLTLYMFRPWQNNILSIKNEVFLYRRWWLQSSWIISFIQMGGKWSFHSMKNSSTLTFAVMPNWSCVHLVAVGRRRELLKNCFKVPETCSPFYFDLAVKIVRTKWVSFVFFFLHIAMEHVDFSYQSLRSSKKKKSACSCETFVFW